MKLITKLIIAAVFGAAVVPAMAQEKANSFQFFGNVNKPSNGDATGNVNAGYGYLLTPQLELGVFVSQQLAATNSTFVAGSVQYYFAPVGRPGQINFYVKGNVGRGSGGGTFTTYGAFGGIAYSMTESAEAFAEVGAQSNKYSGTSSNSSQLNFGLKYRF